MTVPIELKRLFDLVERQRAALTNGVLTLNAVQLNWTPHPNVWSIRQIVQHLVLSDETVGRAQDAVAVKQEAFMFRVMPRAWRRALVLNALNRNVVLPLPSPEVEPREDISLSDLLSRWDEARSEMGCILETIGSNERRYSHPVLGPLTAVQMLELEQAHTAYHARQIEALKSSPKFPRNSEIHFL